MDLSAQVVWWTALGPLAIGDVVGTVVIFGFSRYHDNSSLYDPYWSVAPIVIVIAVFQIFVIRQPVDGFVSLLIGAALVVAGLAFFIFGLRRALFLLLAGWRTKRRTRLEAAPQQPPA